jgi:CRP-like cAMP-binding protein
MLSTDSLLSTTEPFDVKPGEMLIERGQRAPYVLHVDRGRVALGLLQGGRIEHRLGTVSGPAWLDASSAVLGRASVVDAVADGPLTARRVSSASFHGAVMALTPTVRKMLHDLAIAHRQQTELAVSRLAKDAESRCAEWLLHHAQPVDQEALTVQLTQRKRLIAAQLGIAPETLSRVLRHLRERGLISGSGRVVNLVDPGGLRSLAGV